MLEIELANPGTNLDINSSHTFLNKGRGIWPLIEEYLDILEISASDFPRVADLCAGDGSVAALSGERGWFSGNIYCFDKARSLHPLVEGVNWHYWDLCNLGKAIRDGEDLPPNVKNLKGSFDLVVIVQALGVYEYVHEVCGYLVKPNSGLVYSDGNFLSKEHPESWTGEGNTRLMKKVG